MNISNLTDEEYLAQHGVLDEERATELLDRMGKVDHLITHAEYTHGDVKALQNHLDDVGGKLDELQGQLGSMVERFAELKLADNDDFGLMSDLEDAHSKAMELRDDIVLSPTREELGLSSSNLFEAIQEV